MSEEKKHDDAAQVTDEQLKDVAGGGKTFNQSNTMTWDNTTQKKWESEGVEHTDNWRENT